MDRFSGLLRWVFIASALPALTYGGMTAAFRMDHLSFGAIFSQLSWLVPALLGGGAIALLVGLILLFVKAPLTGLMSILAGLVSLAMGFGPIEMRRQAQLVPAIHDISTDVEDPPAFVATAALRKKTDNPAAYDTEQTQAQLDSYPDLETIVLSVESAAAFEACLAAVKQQGLELVEANEAEGRIEATATTRWFGFKDDVVIRVRAGPGGGALVDIRSKSRVGMSDVGANAIRIRQLRDRIKASTGDV